MTTTTTDYLKANVPRGKPYLLDLGSWSSGVTPEISPVVTAGTYYYIPYIIVSMNNAFYANADTEGVIGAGANTLLLSYPNSIVNAVAPSMITLTLNSVRQLLSLMEEVKGDATVGYYGRIKLKTPLKLTNSATQILSIKWTDNGAYGGATTTAKVFGGAAATGTVEFAADGWTILTSDD